MRLFSFNLPPHMPYYFNHYIRSYHHLFCFFFSFESNFQYNNICCCCCFVWHFQKLNAFYFNFNLFFKYENGQQEIKIEIRGQNVENNKKHEKDERKCKPFILCYYYDCYDGYCYYTMCQYDKQKFTLIHFCLSSLII